MDTLIEPLEDFGKEIFVELKSISYAKQYALNIFGKIYAREKQIDGQAAQDLTLKQELRLKEIAPLIQEIKSWIEQESLKVLPKSAIGKAMAYYLNPVYALE